MSHAAEIGVVVSITSVALMAAAFVIDRILKPWRARREAEAEERRMLALITSDEMRSAFRVLAGDPGDPAQGLTPTPGLGKRMTALEAQMQTNGGNSLRDVINQIHSVAVENAEANARVEEAQREAAQLAGEAATLAGTADQRIRELGEEATRRHEDNKRRLQSLEDATREERIRREFYLATLRELYGIELDEPDG